MLSPKWGIATLFYDLKPDLIVNVSRYFKQSNITLLRKMTIFRLPSYDVQVLPILQVLQLLRVQLILQM